MKRTSKFLSFILALIMVISIIPMSTITASAATYSGTCGENLTWEFDESTGTLTISGTGAMDDYQYNNRPWEKYKNSIKTVVINDDVTTIGSEVFDGCYSLASVSIGDAVTAIGDYAFYGCRMLKDLTIPDSVTVIGRWSFGDCGLTSVIIPDSVIIIGDSAFSTSNSITSITIPDSVTTLGDYAFNCCEGLTSVTIGNNVTKIGYATFSGCKNLLKVNFGSSITTIESSAFKWCNSLTDVYYSGTEDEWNNISIDNTYAGNDLLLNATIHYRITGTCGENLTWEFDESTGTLTISGVGEMSDFTEESIPWKNYKYDIKTVIINNGVTTIGDYAFRYCDSLTKITIPDSVTEIGGSAFSYCNSLKSITIPDSVKMISFCLFWGCESLTSIVIPDSITTIDDYAFYDCENLDKVYYEGKESQWKEIYIWKFNDCLLNATIYYNGIDPSKFTGIKGDYFYKNDVILKAYQLVEFEGDFYYIGDRHEIVKNKKVYIKAERTNDLTFADGTPITAGWYDFDTDGKMIILDGIVGNKVYKNNVQLKAYQLVEVDGDFYYIADRHEIVKNKKVYIKADRVEGFVYTDDTPLQAGYYEFDENGKMIILDGIVGNKIYKNNVQLKAYQLVEVDGDFYYIADRHEIVKNNRVYIKSERLNGLTYADGAPLTAGYYDFDENGKMIILDGIVGNKVYKNNTQLKAYQLVEVDGDFYYIGDRHEIVKDKRVYVKAERTNGLTFEDGTPIQAGWYNFDADGKLIIE